MKDISFIERKRFLEVKIIELLNEFQTETGACVCDVDLLTVDVTDHVDDRRKTRVIDFLLSVK